jgi:hypothetical protein
MPIQTLCTSCNTDYVIGTSTSQETLQLIDSQQVKAMLNTAKNKGEKRQKNSFFSDLEIEEHIEIDEDNEQDDSSESDDEMRKSRKKKKRK